VRRNRRKFLKYALVGTGISIVGGSWWLGNSTQRAARWFRQIVADSRRSISPAPSVPNVASWPDNAITICWIGHATVLINFYGIKIRTDPVFGSRVGVSMGIGTAGPKRYVAPALALRDIPPVDLVLLSHAHMDHMDLPSLHSLSPSTRTVTARDTQDILKGTLLKQITELGWNDRTEVKTRAGELQLEAFEVKHWGQRWPSERERGYNGYILRREGKSILFGGDTARTTSFAKLRSRGPFEAAIMPIGAYQPWIWNHCSPEEAVEMANEANARYVVPVHHQTFRLSHEPMNEPIERFRAALAGEPERVALRQIGETFVCPKG
jgi:L-ascorbate metabolism protein UlaG (beta-lactamase superfamily)